MPSVGKIPLKPLPLEELEDATKSAMDKGKRGMKRAQKKVVDVVSKQVRGTTSTIVDGAANGKIPANSCLRESKYMPKISNDSDDVADTQKMEAKSTLSAMSLPAISENAAQPPTIVGTASNGGPSTETILIIYTVVVSAYQAWSFKSEILANQIPFSVVFPFLVVAFLLGYSMDTFFSSQDVQSGGGLGVDTRRQRGVYFATADSVTRTSIANSDDDDDDDDDASDNQDSRTRQLVRRGRNKLKRFGRRYSKHFIYTSDGQSNSGGGVGLAFNNALAKNPLFWSNLSRPHEDVKAWELKLKAPLFAEGPLMDHLLHYPDIRRRKSGKKTAVIHNEDEVAETESDSQETKIKSSDEDGECNEITDISMGNAKLNNTKADSMESVELFSQTIDPLFDLRGMDLFLTDDPEENIWRQPLLNQCGLRDTPTFIVNLMMPFGNMTAYFKLPDWMDDWNNIPEEKGDDPPDIKALKRFLMGDDEYRNARCKVIPHIVDGPLAIRLIRPKPAEHNMDGPRHPLTWSKIQKSIDSDTGRTHAALLECNVDLFSEKTIRKVINIVRPHLQSITIDVAIIISRPDDSDIEEPCACLGLWRIEKVDFESCAVFPELEINEAAEEICMIVSQMEERRIPVKVAG
ncbi:hypothetical protein ACHAXR_012554 [Thalassiosira sp. AJA248-18]